MCEPKTQGSNAHVEDSLTETTKGRKCNDGGDKRHGISIGSNFIGSIVFALMMLLASTSIYSAGIHIGTTVNFNNGISEMPIGNILGFPEISFMPRLDLRETMILCGVTSVALFFYIMQLHATIAHAKLNMPHVPSSIPFLGTALQMLTHTPWDLMESWHRTYGPIYSFTLLGRTCVSIEKPAYLKEVLQSKIQNVGKDVQFAYKPFLPILGTGIVTSEGKSWMKQRRKISTALKVDILEAIPGATLNAVRRLMVKLDKCCVSENKGDDTNEKPTIDIAEELRHLTLQVISETFLSLDPEESDTTFATMYLPIVEEGNKRVWSPERSYMFFMPFFWRYIFGVRRLNNYVSKLIVTRWKSRQDDTKRHKTSVGERKSDILDKVLDHFERENPGQNLNSRWIRQLRDEFKTFMLAGHETSAAMMTWAFFELMKNSELNEEVEKEACLVFGEKDWSFDGSLREDNLPSREELSKLTLSEACLRESLRLYSVVPCVMRQMVKATTIGPNHVIPKGTSINVNIQSVHHNEEYWPKPMSYDPFRFTCGSGETGTSKDKIEPYTFIPFIDGPRNCLGQYLALLESKMVVSLITQRYSLKLSQECFADGEDPRHRYIVPVIPKGSLDVTVTKK